MNVIEVVEVNGKFGFGQISNDPHRYWSGSNDGCAYLRVITDDKLYSIVKCDTNWLYIYRVPGGFAMRITSGDKNVMPVDVIDTNKIYRNTISPVALASAAEEELRYISLVATSNSSNLTKYRKAYGLTLDELAKLSGVNRTVIHRYESGERNIKSARYDTLCKLADALQRTVEQITS